MMTSLMNVKKEAFIQTGRRSGDRKPGWKGIKASAGGLKEAPHQGKIHGKCRYSISKTIKSAREQDSTTKPVLHKKSK